MLGRRPGRLAEQRAEPRGLIDTTPGPRRAALLVVGENYRSGLLNTESPVVEQLIQHSTHPQAGWYRRWARSTASPPAPNERQQP